TDGAAETVVQRLVAALGNRCPDSRTSDASATCAPSA
ncbi:MAG: cutinase family protein, partial [[Mycobacterium] stephanolepidis]